MQITTEQVIISGGGTSITVYCIALWAVSYATNNLFHI